HGKVEVRQVPHVASEPRTASIRAPRAPSPPPARPAQGDTFASMIDENAADATARTETPPPKATAAAKPADKPAKSQPPAANKAADTDKTSEDETSKDKSSDSAAGTTAKGETANKTAKSAISTDKDQVTIDPAVAAQAQGTPKPVTSKKAPDGKTAAKTAERTAVGEVATSSGKPKPVGEADDKPKSDKDKNAEGNDKLVSPSPVAG